MIPPGKAALVALLASAAVLGTWFLAVPAAWLLENLADSAPVGSDVRSMLRGCVEVAREWAGLMLFLLAVASTSGMALVAFSLCAAVCG